jgi:glycosyltransferase involved in cell wall biosynthesis
MIRIAQVCHRYYPRIGGVQTHVKEISERLAKKYDVSVLTTDPSGKLPEEEVINGVEVRRFKSWAPYGAYYFSRALKKYLMENSSDYHVVHAHGYHAFPALYAAEAKGRNKFVFTPHYHGTGHTFFRSLLHIPYKFLGKKIFEKADKIVCVSNFERSLVLRNFKVDEKKVVVIPNGLNLEEFKGLERRRKNYGAILYVGRLEKYKGVQYLIKALPKLGSDIILEVVGKGSCKESLVRLARKLGVENRVKFYQDLPRRELLQAYVDADLFVLLSKHEAYGISVAEALASGTPCIVANTSALRGWIDNENCFGIEYPIDVDKLVTLINEVIGKGVGDVKLPSWDEVVENLFRVYKSIEENAQGECRDKNSLSNR